MHTQIQGRKSWQWEEEVSAYFPCHTTLTSFKFIDLWLSNLVWYYSQLFFHMPYLDAWVLKYFTLAEWVQQSCTELFHPLSQDSLNEISPIKTEDLPVALLLIQGHESEKIVNTYILYFQSYYTQFVKYSNCCYTQLLTFQTLLQFLKDHWNWWYETNDDLDIYI